ncbi:unnamed protein product, partial [Clonostachys chloroleuca]
VPAIARPLLALDQWINQSGKRNTSRPVFTSHERQLAKASWKSSSARLNRDSYLPFGSCSLCLELARDPVTCSRGDIFCRECALANILSQKKELKRANKARRDAELEATRNDALQDEEDQAQVVKDFELVQAGLQAGSSSAGKKKSYFVEEAPASSSNGGQELVVAGSHGTKRKLALDEDELNRAAKEDRAKARRATEQEKASSDSLPSFWTPSLTPDIRDSKLAPAAKKSKDTPLCPASNDGNSHPFSMNKLITVRFHEQYDTASQQDKRSCPSCLKLLTNASAPILAKRCGHVLCSKCVKQFILPSAKDASQDTDSIITCYVCDETVALASDAPGSSQSLPVGLVALKSEGTGFSARGASTVEKSGVGFQC